MSDLTGPLSETTVTIKHYLRRFGYPPRDVVTDFYTLASGKYQVDVLMGRVESADVSASKLGAALLKLIHTVAKEKADEQKF